MRVQKFLSVSGTNESIRLQIYTLKRPLSRGHSEILLGCHSICVDDRALYGKKNFVLIYEGHSNL